MPSVNIYYKSTALSQLEKYPSTTTLLTVPAYSDEECTVQIGSLTKNSILINSLSLKEIQSSLSLNNGLSILYNYINNGTKSVTVAITYQSESVGPIKKLERQYINDEVRVLILTF